jgi:hypothetical protein
MKQLAFVRVLEKEDIKRTLDPSDEKLTHDRIKVV